MAQSDRLFVGIEQTVIATAQGDFHLPILYRDGSMLGLGYRQFRATTFPSRLA